MNNLSVKDLIRILSEARSNNTTQIDHPMDYETLQNYIAVRKTRTFNLKLNTMKRFIKQNEGQILFTATVLAFAIILIALDFTNIITIR